MLREIVESVGEHSKVHRESFDLPGSGRVAGKAEVRVEKPAPSTNLVVAGLDYLWMVRRLSPDSRAVQR